MKKLHINKETLHILNADEKNLVEGAMPPSFYSDCQVCWTDAGPKCPTNSAIVRTGPCCA